MYMLVCDFFYLLLLDSQILDQGVGVHLYAYCIGIRASVNCVDLWKLIDLTVSVFCKWLTYLADAIARQGFPHTVYPKKHNKLINPSILLKLHNVQHDFLTKCNALTSSSKITRVLKPMEKIQHCKVACL